YTFQRSSTSFIPICRRSSYRPCSTVLKPNLITSSRPLNLILILWGYIERILDFHSDVDDTQQYTDLTIIKPMVNNLRLWSEKHDESEVTSYRRFASILDILLVDTGVILAEGETSLQSLKLA
ncbi:hypothetical protein CU098_005798, partial [Rhizopus stolonifer]